MQRNTNVKTADGDSLATHALLFYYQSIADRFRYPVAYFLTKTATAAELSLWVTEGIALLTNAGFDVKYLLCDGGSANRSFINVRARTFRVIVGLTPTDACSGRV